MRDNRPWARVLAGLLVAGTLTLGAAAPAQARDSGWNGTVAASHSISINRPLCDSGWNGT